MLKSQERGLLTNGFVLEPVERRHEDAVALAKLGLKNERLDFSKQRKLVGVDVEQVERVRQVLGGDILVDVLIEVLAEGWRH